MAHTDPSLPNLSKGSAYNGARFDMQSSIRLVPVTTMRNIKIMLLILLAVDVLNLIFAIQTMNNIDTLQRLLRL